tara:strand:- start:36877 stop:37212 length:336 start_codon:yes stop_codon:yes gene_type:complete
MELEKIIINVYINVDLYETINDDDIEFISLSHRVYFTRDKTTVSVIEFLSEKYNIEYKYFSRVVIEHYMNIEGVECDLRCIDIDVLMPDQLYYNWKIKQRDEKIDTIWKNE